MDEPPARLARIHGANCHQQCCTQRSRLYVCRSFSSSFSLSSTWSASSRSSLGSSRRGACRSPWRTARVPSARAPRPTRPTRPTVATCFVTSASSKTAWRTRPTRAHRADSRSQRSSVWRRNNEDQRLTRLGYNYITRQPGPEDSGCACASVASLLPGGYSMSFAHRLGRRSTPHLGFGSVCTRNSNGPLRNRSLSFCRHVSWAAGGRGLIPPTKRARHQRRYGTDSIR